MRRRLTRSSLSITQRSATGIQTTKLNVWSRSGHSKVASTILPDQETQAENLDQLRSVLLNISESVAQIQQRKSLEDLDISKSIADTKAALAALYASIGYTTGIEELYENRS